MENKINFNAENLLDKIEKNAKEFESVPLAFINEDFIIKAIQNNTLVTRYLKQEDFKNDRIAFTIALIVDKHKDLISEKLQEEDFYLKYIIQKIKNKDISDKETYINKEVLSKEENVLHVIKEAGFFKLKYIGDKLKDKETIVDMFCDFNKSNQIYASARIKEEAAISGKKVSQYVKTKLFYKRLDDKFMHKYNEKVVKI